MWSILTFLDGVFLAFDIPSQFITVIEAKVSKVGPGLNDKEPSFTKI